MKWFVKSLWFLARNGFALLGVIVVLVLASRFLPVGSQQQVRGLTKGWYDSLFLPTEADKINQVAEDLEERILAARRHQKAEIDAECWQEADLTSSRAPIFLPDKMVEFDIRQLERGLEQALLSGVTDQAKRKEILAKIPDLANQCVAGFARARQGNQKDRLFILPGDLKPFKDGEKVLYWDFTRPVRVDFSRKVWSPYRAMVLVPCAQRAVDGVGHIYGLAFYEDVKSTNLLPAEWGKSMNPQQAREGGREIIDRFVTVLKRGQGSQPLVYMEPSWDTGEKGKYERKYKLRAIGSSTLLITINGQTFVSPPHEEVDTNSVKSRGSFVVEVKLGNDAEQAEVPVEFVYYRQRT